MARVTRTASLKGALAEIELERRLLELGYPQVFRPSRMDHAVDYCVWTSKGWVGIQVKTAQRINRGKEHARRVPTLDMAWAGRGRGYYVANGVQVFAVWTGHGFYVIPVTEIRHERRVRVERTPFWEAWHRVLGEPASMVHSTSESAAERQENLFTA